MIRSRLYEVLGARRSRGEAITMRSLARAADVDYTTLWRWASGRTAGTNHELLNALCRELNCTPGDLLVYIPDSEHPPDA